MDGISGTQESICPLDLQQSGISVLYVYFTINICHFSHAHAVVVSNTAQLVVDTCV